MSLFRCPLIQIHYQWIILAFMNHFLITALYLVFCTGHSAKLFIKITPFNPQNICMGKYYRPHWTDEDTEAVEDGLPYLIAASGGASTGTYVLEIDREPPSPHSSKSLQKPQFWVIEDTDVIPSPQQLLFCSHLTSSLLLPLPRVLSPCDMLTAAQVAKLLPDLTTPGEGCWSNGKDPLHLTLWLFNL